MSIPAPARSASRALALRILAVTHVIFTGLASSGFQFSTTPW